MVEARALRVREPSFSVDSLVAYAASPSVAFVDVDRVDRLGDRVLLRCSALPLVRHAGFARALLSAWFAVGDQADFAEVGAALSARSVAVSVRVGCAFGVAVLAAWSAEPALACAALPPGDLGARCPRFWSACWRAVDGVLASHC